MTQREPGELFVVRNAGNIIPTYGPAAGGVSASIEYAVAALGIENLVVCGHSDCGAMKAILREEKLEKMPAVTNWIKHAAAAKEIVDATLPPSATSAARLHALVHENVLCQLRNLQTHPIVAARLATGRLKLYGWVYNIENGTIDTFDAETCQLRAAHQGLACARHAENTPCLFYAAGLVRLSRFSQGRSPSPRPSPSGREDDVATVATGLPLPWGEGGGEGF